MPHAVQTQKSKRLLEIIHMLCSENYEWKSTAIEIKLLEIKWIIVNVCKCGYVCECKCRVFECVMHLSIFYILAHSGPNGITFSFQFIFMKFQLFKWCRLFNRMQWNEQWKIIRKYSEKQHTYTHRE